MRGFGQLVVCVMVGLIGGGVVMAESVETPGVLRHLVMLKFKDGAAADKVKAVETAFVALPSKISAIQDFEWGMNVSPEGLNKGFTHCYLVTFKDQAGLDAYLPHKSHKAFVALLDGLLADGGVFVLDYVAK